ncbi:iron-siderophore ABC transporter substrate-binding protein [Bifidobacterium amazonense]|uniref:Iron-siderophore ABC transporter substrate-binding protein n=1 Tax=Bifidobacterium amazonense TaxID=2809027 RepID=A0ABS9VY12_9BIFI|nr:iron-siderophore ABC transporter substrate-binding protein [Bifidobacterium amazonense]MCH9276958.1 iron-siderophore ABC transporter substrate-binding protein [Bifidobacterium amazonense]
MPVSHQHAKTLRSLIAAALAAATMLGAAACGTSQNASEATDTSSSSSSSTESGAFPVTIKHALGETTIDSQPKRVAAVGWGADDALIALDVIPVTMQKNTYGKTVDGFLSWTKQALDDKGVAEADMPQLHDESDDIDAEAIAATEPDLILGPYSGITEEQYKTLSKIAPTVPYIKTAWSEPWRDEIKVVAEAVGKTTEGDTLIADLERTIADEAAKYPAIKGKTAAVMYMDASKLSSFSIYNTLDTRAQFLNDLGFDTPESVKKISENADSFYTDVSAENADQYSDIDVIVTYGTSDLLAALQKDPLLSKIPAIKRGSVVVINSDTVLANALNPTALSIPATTADYMTMLGEAAAKVQ